MKEVGEPSGFGAERYYTKKSLQPNLEFPIHLTANRLPMAT
jgi:hypothetical protein